MKHLLILAMLVLGTGFAQAQTSNTKEMPMTDMDMPMAEMPNEMDMLANKVVDAFSMFTMHVEKNKMVCMDMCAEKDMMIMDLKMFKKHAEMVLSKKQMKSIMNMMMMEMDMKMDMKK